VSAVRVTLFTAPHCHLCEQAKEVLDRVGADYDIEVETLSEESEWGQALMLEHLIAFPPGVLVDGKAFSYGRLSERKLRRELDRTGAAKKGLTPALGVPDVVSPGPLRLVCKPEG
jgi:glutaredoxin